MFRAIPIEGFDITKTYSAQATRRMPSNVPYVVDNVWEWLRPEHFPSRRFAAYASPTPQLALENASAAGNNRDLYTVCEVVFNTENIKLAHIVLKDAKYHDDISRIQRAIAAFLGKDFTNMSIAEKSLHAALYLPSVAKEEMQHYFDNVPNAKVLENELRLISKFWSDAENSPQSHNGELFFEVSNDVSYTLVPVKKRGYIKRI